MAARLINLSRHWRRLRADRRGAMAIEFGFALPVLILITAGLFDVSLLLWSSSTIKNAAAEGARFAVVNGGASPTPASAADIETFIRTQAVGVPATALNVDVTWQPNNQSGSRVTVALAYTHNFLIGGLVGLDPVTINKTSRMIVF
ncbi:MAG: pilus assembly protein [Alphaproteobacteria bacterium]|nr:pilus assembly protein [Alphaproteobacteria bacterium]MCZ6840180.1 pilus assembly protein [Alphaproteobacteria bacterium]